MVRQKRTRPWPKTKAVLDMQHPEFAAFQVEAMPPLPGPGPHIGRAMPFSSQVLTEAFKKGEIGQMGQPPFQPSSARQTFPVSESRPHLQSSPMLSGGSTTGETNEKENDMAKKDSPVPVVEGLVVYGPGLSNNDIWRGFRKKYWNRLCSKSSLLERKQGIQPWLVGRIHSLLSLPSACPGSAPCDDILVVLFSDAESRRKAMQWFLNSSIELSPYTVSSQPDAFIDVRYTEQKHIPYPSRGMGISGNGSCSSGVPSIEEGGQGHLKSDLLPSWKPPGQQHISFQPPVQTIPANIAPAPEGGGKPKCEIQTSTAFRSASLCHVAEGPVKNLPPAPPAPLQAVDSTGSASSPSTLDIESEMELHRSRVVAALGVQTNKGKKRKRNRKKAKTMKQNSLPTTSLKVQNRPTGVIDAATVINAATPPLEVQQPQTPVLNEQLMSSLVTCRMTKALTAGDSSSLIRTDSERRAQEMLLSMSKGSADNGNGGAHLPSPASDDLEEGELSLQADNSSTMGSETIDEIAKQRELVLIALKLSRSKSKLNNKESDLSSVSRGSTEGAIITTAKNNKPVTSSHVSSAKNNSTLRNEEGAVSNAIGGGSSSMSTDNTTTKQLKELKPKRPLQEKPKPSPHVVRLRQRSPTPAASDALLNLQAKNRIQKLVIFRSTPAAVGGNDVESYPYSIKGPFFGPDGMGVFPSGWANGHAASSVSAAVKQQKREMELRELQCKERALRLTNIQGRIKRKEQELKDLQESITRYDDCMFTAQLSSAVVVVLNFLIGVGCH